MNAVTPAQKTTRAQSIRTPSGIEIWHVEDYTVPVLSVEFAFLGGAAQDPAGKCGLANLLAGLMDEGAGALASQEFQEALEEKAIELSFDAGRDRLDGSLRTLADNAGGFAGATL
jgi:zinc protease